MQRRRVAFAVAVLVNAVAVHAVPTPYLLSPAHAKIGFDVIVDAVGGDFFIPREELKIARLRLTLVPDVAGRPGVVRLADLGVIRLDEQNGELHLHVRPELLEPQILGASELDRKFKIPTQQAMTALIADYDFRLDHSSGKSKFGLMSSASTWAFGNRIDASVIAGTDIDAQFTHLRLVREDLDTSSLLEAGTIAAASGSRASPGQIIGVGIRKNRGITPGYITGPQLRVDGVSRAQSTIDILIDNQRVKHTTQPGPFSVIAEPLGNGGLASVIVRDDLGEERVVTANLWANPMLLGIGQTEYALSAGGVSRGGLRSDDLVASGYYRRGIENWVTAEAGFEATKDYQRLTGAADVATAVGNFAFDFAAGGGRSASARYVMPTQSIDEWIISGSAQVTSTSADFQYAGGNFSGPGGRYQRGLNLSATREGWSVNSTFAATPSGRFVSASVGHKLTSAGASINITAMRFEDAFGKPSNSMFASLSLPLGGRFASLSASNTRDGIRKNVSFGGRLNDDVSLSANASGISKLEQLGANASFTVGEASANVGISKPIGQDAAYRGSIRGGLIAHIGGVTMSNAGARDGGFAVVDLGAPGVQVLNGFGGRATTDASGFAVLRLPSLQAARISIDPNSAPDDLDLMPFDVVAHRRGGVKLERHPVVTNGQFVQIDGAKPGDVLIVAGQRLAITDRGAWIELAKGEYAGKVGERDVQITVE